MTGGIAHDFNNVLGVMLGYADLLLGSCADAKQQRYINEVIRAAERAKSLTTRLLVFSRKEARSVEQVDINELLVGSEALLKSTLTPRNRLDLHLEDHLWPTRLEKSRLEDAILNICINARHAMPDGGLLVISSENIQLLQDAAKALDVEAGEYVRLRFEDNGEGMDEETGKRIFDPFFTTKGDQGTGLGMSQVYGFVKQSNGAISIDTAIGSGTAISLFFPRDEEAQCAETATQSDDSADLTGSETILVVDDEAVLRAMLQEQLSGYGYKVITAASAKEALELLQSTAIDLVVTDVIMPVMDGYRLAREIGKQWPQLPIQLVSGFDETIQTYGLEEIRKECLGKPVRIAELLTRIRQLLDKDYPG